MCSLFEAHLNLKIELLRPIDMLKALVHAVCLTKRGQVQIGFKLRLEVDDFAEVDAFIRLTNVEDS